MPVLAGSASDGGGEGAEGEGGGEGGLLYRGERSWLQYSIAGEERRGAPQVAREARSG